MKKISFISGLLILPLLFSCSKGDKDNNTAEPTSVMAEQSESNLSTTPPPPSTNPSERLKRDKADRLEVGTPLVGEWKSKDDNPLNITLSIEKDGAMHFFYLKNGYKRIYVFGTWKLQNDLLILKDRDSDDEYSFRVLSCDDNTLRLRLGEDDPIIVLTANYDRY